MRLHKHLMVGGAVVIAAAAMTAAALGGVHSGNGSNMSSASPGVRVALASSRLGPVLVDGRGHTLYLFAKDKHGRSACSGQCAGFWPPLIASAKPLAAAGAKASLLGTTRRADGRLQVTYNHHPLYSFVKDAKKGQLNGEEVDAFGAEWYAVSAAGAKVENAMAEGSGASDPAPGGYGY